MVNAAPSENERVTPFNFAIVLSSMPNGAVARKTNAHLVKEQSMKPFPSSSMVSLENAWFSMIFMFTPNV